MTLSKAKRIVLKIGSALLVDAETRRIRDNWLASVAADIALCRKQGQEIIVVTSGAVAVGLTHLGLVKSPSLKLEEKQAYERPDKIIRTTLISPAGLVYLQKKIDQAIDEGTIDELLS